MAGFNEWLQRGWADVKTAARQGLREVRNVLYAESPIARDLDPGTWGNALQREIYEARHLDLDPAGNVPATSPDRSSLVDGHVRAAETVRERSPTELVKDAAREPQPEPLTLDKE